MTRTGRAVPITLDHERHLRFDFNALADLEQALGYSLAAMPAIDALGIRAVRAFVWAGLSHEDPKLTPRDAGDLLQTYLDAGGSFDELGAKLTEALQLAGYARKDVPDAPLPSAPATGSPTPST